jgi:hypothetical protein
MAYPLRLGLALQRSSNAESILEAPKDCMGEYSSKLMPSQKVCLLSQREAADLEQSGITPNCRNHIHEPRKFAIERALTQYGRDLQVETKRGSRTKRIYEARWIGNYLIIEFLRAPRKTYSGGFAVMQWTSTAPVEGGGRPRHIRSNGYPERMHQSR